MPDRDDETGQYNEDYADREFIEALRAEDGMTATSTVADAVGCDHDTARRRLDKLAAKGVVERLQPSRSIFWRLADE